MTASRDVHDMKKTIVEITDEKIQLYLSKELDGPIAQKIEQIDQTSEDEILTKQELKVKEKINALRKVDQILFEAATASYKMPIELEQKISNALSNRKIKNESKGIDARQIMRRVIKRFDLTSMVSGCALAAFGMFFVIGNQQGMLLNETRFAQDETIFRGTGSTNGVCDIKRSTQWQITESFAFSAPLCGDEIHAGGLNNSKKVKIGQKFFLRLIALKDVEISIEYSTLADRKRDVIFEGFMEKGTSFDSEVFEFGLPIGTDYVDVKSSANDHVLIQFEVE